MLGQSWSPVVALYSFFPSSSFQEYTVLHSISSSLTVYFSSCDATQKRQNCFWNRAVLESDMLPELKIPTRLKLAWHEAIFLCLELWCILISSAAWLHLLQISLIGCTRMGLINSSICVSFWTFMVKMKANVGTKKIPHLSYYISDTLFESFLYYPS